jgi:hypothetical protein
MITTFDGGCIDGFYDMIRIRTPDDAAESRRANDVDCGIRT